MIWIDLTYNLALLIALSVISGFVSTRWKKNSRRGMLLQGLIFGGSAAIGMLRPFVFAPGLIFDGRSVMISLGALFFGPWTAATACLMTIPIRITQGGPGELMGVMVILVSAAIGTGVHIYRRRKPKEMPLDSLFIFGLAVHLAMLAMTICLPQSMILPVLKHIGGPVILIYPLATILIGKILSDQATRNELLQKIKEAAENLRITLNSIGDAVISTDINGNITELNPIAEALTGWTRHQAVGTPLDTVFRIINEQTRQPVENPAAKVLAAGTIVGLANHTLLIAKDGREIPIADSGAPIRNDAGKITGVVLVFRDQTRERETQQALRESERQYKTLFDRANDGIFILSADGKLLSVNPSFAHMHGYSEEEMLTLSLKDLDTPESARLASERINRLLAGESLTFEVNHYHKDGHIFPLEVSCSLISYGEKKFILGLHRDISERCRMQNAIQKRILALTRPLNEAAEVTFEDLFDLKEIQRIQDEFSDATGVTSAIFALDGTEITEVSNTSYFCRHIIRTTPKGCANCAKSDKTLAQEFDPKAPMVKRCQSAGLWDGCIGIMIGDRHIANWTLGQVRDENHTEEQALQYAREIDADEQEFLEAFRKLPRMSGEHFKQIAQALFTLANQLATSAYQNIQQARFIADEQRRTEEHHRLSTAINQSPEAVVITGPDGIIQYVNPAFEAITGYSSKEVFGKNPSILKSGTHDASFYSNLWKTINAGKVWEGRFINKRKSGELYTEEASISPVKNPSGAITGYVAVKRNITEELLKEEQFRQSQKMEAVGQLAGGIAHDFNNILQAILGFSEILLTRLKGDSVEHHNASEIQKASKRAAELIRQLLAFSRKQPVERKRINLNAELSDAEVLLQIMLGKKVSCRFELSNDLHPIYADHSQLTQIIMNLAVNARDAMPNGGRLTLATENITFEPQAIAGMPEAEPGSFVCLSVTDTGCGMSPEVRNHLFEPFFTTKAVGQGTGLGLAVVYGIVKQGKGWIHVYSEEGLGSTFKIYLPTCEAASEDHEAESAIHHGRILLVEDDADMRNLVLRILETSGYESLSVSSAEEALQLFERENGRFDLLFSDIVLPHQSGVNLADQLRAKSPALRILLYSGYQDQRERWETLDIKGYHFLKKPFSVTGLLSAVHDAITEINR
jgi:PAS domain S-box-containing protein